jgi:hypothetical protein
VNRDDGDEKNGLLTQCVKKVVFERRGEDPKP